MGELVLHVGELGQGAMLKLINNALGAANAAALAEALLLAKSDSTSTSTPFSSGVRGRLRRLGSAHAEGAADARARLHDALGDGHTCSRTCASAWRKLRQLGFP